jgi:predicted small lipoprotein YifL
MRRPLILTLVLAAAAALVSLAACGSSQPVTYAPAAYGVPGHCYYVYSRAEAYALQAAGYCPRSWVPTRAPMSWQEEYWDYYDSPAYYTHYVPARVRTIYVKKEAAFGLSYRGAIASRRSSAVYRSSSGTLVKGTRVSKARFGSGTSFGSAGTRYGGGSRFKSGSGTSSGSRGSRSSSGGFGGGSRGRR